MTDNPKPERADRNLERILTVLRRRASLIVLCAIVSTAAAVSFSLLQQERYVATASLLFRDPEFTQTVFGGEGTTFSGRDAARQAATNVELVGLREISDRTATAAGTGLMGDEVASRIDVTPEGQSDVITISATDPDPEHAALLANTFASEFIEFRASADRSRLLDAKQLAEDQFQGLTQEEQQGPRGAQLSRGAERLGIIASLQTGNAELVQTAEAPTDPSSPQPLRSGIFGFIVGLMLGVGLAFLFERFNRRLRDLEEAREAYGFAIIGTIPESKAIEELNDGASETLPFAETEAFRMLRASLRYFNVDQDMNTVLITSAAAHEGKSTVAWNLANVAATSGAVLLLEADLRNPSILRQREISPGPGLTELLTHQVDLTEATQSRSLPASSNGKAVGNPVLDVIIAGSKPPNPAELLESKNMADLLSTLQSRYDLIIVDTAPVGVVADALALTSQVGGVLLVSRMGRTPSDAARAVSEQLQRLRAPVLGVVANGIRAPRNATYGYGYAYGTSDKPAQPELL